jgi:microcin C transport system substrate-binding protein
MIKRHLLGLLAVFVFLLSAVCIRAQDTSAHSSKNSSSEMTSQQSVSGIAMMGNPKYGPNFKHFDYANPNAPKGGHIRLGVLGGFDSVNPFHINGTLAAGLELGEGLYFEKLTRRSEDEPFSLYGYIAKTIDLSPDRSQMTITLRDEAKWHDDTPITADDLLFSIGFFKDHGTVNQRMYYSQVAEMTKRDDKTVHIVFKKSESGQTDPELPMLLALITIIPKSEENNPALVDVSLTPIKGSGPYKISKIEPGKSITYERVKDHWAKDLPICVGYNNFDSVTFDYYREDHAMLEAFKVGEIDCRLEKDVNIWLSSYDFPAIRDGKIKKMEIPNRSSIGMQALVFNTRNPLFLDINVRKALTKLFDAEWINQTLYKGKMKRTKSFFEGSPMASNGHLSNDDIIYIQSIKSDVSTVDLAINYSTEDDRSMQERTKEALQLLQQAGWKIEQGKLLHHEKSTPFAFEILVKDEQEMKIALAFAKSLSDVGIDAKVQLEKTQYGPRKVAFQFDMVFHPFGQSLSPGNDQKFYWSSQAADKQGSRNYPGIKDPLVDLLCEKISLSKSISELKMNVHCLDKVLLSGYYVIPTFHLGMDMLAVKSNIGIPVTDTNVKLDFKRWWITDAK